MGKKCNHDDNNKVRVTNKFFVTFRLLPAYLALKRCDKTDFFSPLLHCCVALE